MVPLKQYLLEDLYNTITKHTDTIAPTSRYFTACRSFGKKRRIHILQPAIIRLEIDVDKVFSIQT